MPPDERSEGARFAAGGTSSRGFVPGQRIKAQGVAAHIMATQVQLTAHGIQHTRIPAVTLEARVLAGDLTGLTADLANLQGLLHRSRGKAQEVAICMPHGVGTARQCSHAATAAAGVKVPIRVSLEGTALSKTPTTWLVLIDGVAVGQPTTWSTAGSKTTSASVIAPTVAGPHTLDVDVAFDDGTSSLSNGVTLTVG